MMTELLEPIWIWRSRETRVNDFAYLRRTFETKRGLKYALLQVSAHHTAHVYVNGVRLGGYGSPAPTDPSARKYYNEYDVTSRLGDGTGNGNVNGNGGGMHCLTADALYLGGSGQNYANGAPGFWLRLSLEYEDGSRSAIVSDASWEALADGPHDIGSPFQQNRRLSPVERFDASKWIPAWRLPGVGHGLATLQAVLSPAADEGWRLMRQAMPEGQIESEIAPKVVIREMAVDELVQLFDAGRIVSGWPRLSLQGHPGATIRMRYAERLDGEGRVERMVCNETSDTYYDEYVMRGGEGLETWQPAFAYKAFRYVEVTGYPEAILPGEGLVVCFAHTDLHEVGGFDCSDAMLNKLFEVCLHTQKNNVLGQVVDCPHREQAQYLADADLQAETLLYNFDAVETLRKTLADFADAQLPDGSFPFVAPGNYGHPDFHIRIPEWDAHFVSLLWKLYEATDDVGLLDEFWEPLRRITAVFLERADRETGLVPKGEGWNISDWPYPTVDHSGPYLTVQQLKAAHALDLVGRVAELLGREEGANYRLQAESLRSCIVRELFDASMGAYHDSQGSSSRHQGVTAYALHTDQVPAAYRTQALEYVASREWECRTVLSLPLLRALFDGGMEAEAYAILSRRDYPGWGYMVAQGAESLWEGWDDIESHSHAWNGYPARLLQEYVAGIRSLAPGFAIAEFRPYIPPSLDHAVARVWTPRGALSAGWFKEQGNIIRFTADVPEGITAYFRLSDRPDLPARELHGGKQEWRAEPR
ncbi:MAG: alpha-rhamnosidase [Paenibacillus sp.]|nr:alpha-rhamnosidase [Paenibacillus sp.]